jgi:hypothetical protein
MANDNNIQHFTAVDIEKYHKGLLSSTAMNAMEKAALDDPFLADALEGYATPGVNVAGDIAELKKRLEERTEQAKVIPMNPVVDTKRNNFKILRAAVILAFVAGAAFLMYQFNNKNKTTEIAQAPAKTETIQPAGSPDTTTAVPAGNNTNTTTNGSVFKNEKETKPETVTNTATGGANTFAKEKIATEATTTPAAPIINDAVKDETKRKKEKVDDLVIIPKELAKQEISTPAKATEKKELDYKTRNVNDGFYAKETELNKAFSANSKRADDQLSRTQLSNTFRGRITDVNNIGVPFANVTNPQDNVGTYTDAKGNFNLTYPDSVLNVQVRSLGFENSNVQLRNNVASTQIVLQEDKSLSEVVINNQKPNAAARSRDANIKIEESEPTDGWDNYDAYLSNNLKVPDDIKGKQTPGGSVQLSFEVDKNGEPINIRIEKSLCDKCDKEAKRLVKDGPKWKQGAAKKGRTTVTINF